MRTPSRASTSSTISHPAGAVSSKIQNESSLMGADKHIVEIKKADKHNLYNLPPPHYPPKMATMRDIYPVVQSILLNIVPRLLKTELFITTLVR